MILVDAGPLVALVDASDQHHRRCRDAAVSIREPLCTIWPVLTEALYLLMDLPRGQQAVLEMVERGSLALATLDRDDLPRIRELLTKYANRPIDLADAALVRVAEREGIATVFTIDRRDFEVYRIHGRKRFRLIP
jgi:predicted nucleic acid-binding protein